MSPCFFCRLACLLVVLVIASAFTADRIDCSADGECSAFMECIVTDGNANGHNCTLHCLVSRLVLQLEGFSLTGKRGGAACDLSGPLSGVFITF